MPVPVRTTKAGTTMGTVIIWPGRVHSRPRTKSSAVILPFDQALSLSRVSQFGRCTPRRMRLIVGRDTPIAEATCSSSSSRAFMMSDRCAITPMYAMRTKAVKRKCTPGVLADQNAGVHDTHMSKTAEKKVAPRFKEPKFRPTFIKQWRKAKGLTQEQLAERVAQYLADQGDDKGYTHASIQRLESGKIGYTQIVLEALADALGTDPASLLMRDPSDRSAMWTVWDQALPAERELIEQQAEVVVKNRRRTA